MSEPFIADPQLAHFVRLLGSLEEGLAALQLVKLTGAPTLTKALHIAADWHAIHVAFINEKGNRS